MKTPCWPWMGSKNKRGYGCFKFFAPPRRNLMCHRIAYVYDGGELADGEDLLHECDTEACCRPSHLHPGDQAMNMREMVARGRGRPPSPGVNNKRVGFDKAQEFRQLVASGKSALAAAKELGIGEASAYHIVSGRSYNPNGRKPKKLSAAAVVEIRRRYEAGERQTDLAAEFKVSKASIHLIVKRKRRTFGPTLTAARPGLTLATGDRRLTPMPEALR